MRIGVDIREAYAGKAGKGRYVAETVAALAEIDRENAYVLYGRSDRWFPKLSENWRIRLLPQSGISWHLAVARELIRDGIDLFLATTSHIVPCITKVPTVLIVYDLSAFLLAEARLPLKVRVLERFLLKHAARRATAIAAISENTRADLIRVCGVRPEKLTVIGAGISDDYRPTNRHIQGLPEHFVLFVGTIEPRKNVGRLIRAYSMLDAPLRKSFPLVIVGKRGWHWDDVDRAVEECHAKDETLFLDYVADDDLPAVYSNADVFIYPSLYEGFGLPPLEAMACGTPVIVSSNSSLPEVVGDAGILVDPTDTAAISRALCTVLSNEKLRDDLRERGLERSKHFSWDQTARSLLDVCLSAGCSGIRK